jgi:glycosyltransferase involved in cell wall biosynthesis
MKICFFANANSIHTRHWTRYFRDLGHQVSVVTLTPAVPEPGIELHCLEYRWRGSYQRVKWRYRLLQLPGLWRTVRDIKPDILNAHFLSNYGLFGALVRPNNCPLVISLHGSDILIFPKRSFLHRWAIRFALSRAHMITSVAQHMTQVLYKYMVPGKPVQTLQYGVDTDLFRPLVASTPREPVCISTRYMVPVSNLETVLLAAQILERQGSPIRINIAGTGVLLPLLRQKASELQLNDRVSFLGDMGHLRTPELLRSASLYVSMSLSDGASISLLEAMACGTFPVVSDIAGNREWINDGVNGYLVPPDSPVKLAQRLTDAWNQPELRSSAAKYNRSLILEKGDYQKNMKIIESAYVHLVQQFRGTC